MCQNEGTHQFVMSFSPPVVGCLLKKAHKRGGGHRHPRTPPGYAPVLGLVLIHSSQVHQYSFQTVKHDESSDLPLFETDAQNNFQIETHNFKFAKHVSDDRHPSSVVNTSEPLVGVI